MKQEQLNETVRLHGMWHRGEIGGARADLDGADLARADLDGANLAGANLDGADLAGADLAGANLDGANLDGADLAGAYLAGADLDGAYLDGAYLARAYLAGANLAGANLAGADLAGADLDGAYLDGAYLARANLAGADLAGANLAGANLARADLDGANLAGANLAGAYLAGAYLDGAYLARANLAGAYLAGAYLAGARNVPQGIEQTDPPEPYERKAPNPGKLAAYAQRYRERHPEVPVVERLDSRILEAVTTGGGTLDMGQWHSESCKTTHCRAGWAITIAGQPGADLEKRYGPQRAGSMIYRASTGRSPHFFATTERALEDIKRCAAEEQSQ